MMCPVCQVELKMADRVGVEIDYCPQCRGVWLDRGELDKILERSREPLGRSDRPMDRGDYERHDEHERKHDDRDEYDQRGMKKQRRGGFLGDLFDF